VTNDIAAARSWRGSDAVEVDSDRAVGVATTSFGISCPIPRTPNRRPRLNLSLRLSLRLSRRRIRRRRIRRLATNSRLSDWSKDR
jgi:hypothetical protein